MLVFQVDRQILLCTEKHIDKAETSHIFDSRDRPRLELRRFPAVSLPLGSKREATVTHPAV